jgi:hypothetical protein
MTSRSTTETSASEHEARYETLRWHALAPRPLPTARDGLAVLLRQGIAAWMDAWSSLPAPVVRTTQDECETPPLPHDASVEVVHVLAAMALGHIRNPEEVHA